MGVCNRKFYRDLCKRELKEFLKDNNLTHGSMRRAVGRLVKPTLKNKLLSTLGGNLMDKGAKPNG